MLATLAGIVFAAAVVVPAAAQDLAGRWFTSRGVLELEVNGGKAKGRYGEDKSSELRGEVRGREIAFEATEGQAALEGTLTVDKGGHRFEGRWKSANGAGTWRGWRLDPAAKKGKAANVAGFWRTSWGMLELEQKGAKLTGGYGAQGWSTVKGEVAGRRVTLDYEGPFGGGKLELDVDADGKLALGSASSSRGEWPLLAQRLEGHTRAVAPKPGAVVAGIGKNRLVYWLRAPKSWKAGSNLPLLVVLHGSNYVSRPYVESIGGTEIGERYVVVGIDGEQWLDTSEPAEPRQNYTYVNFMGKSTYEGYPNTHRESPALVAELVRDLQQQLGSKRTFVGGHSQGGFLTWFLAMHYPGLVHGVFPMSSGMAMQCEPDVFADAALRAQQREVAIAVVHGKNDDTVPFQQGEGTFQSCLGNGFPRLRLFANEAGHGFSSLPWIEAVKWLEVMTSDDAKMLVPFAREAIAAGRWRDATAAFVRLRSLKPVPPEAAGIAMDIDKAAAGGVARFGKLMGGGDGAKWIDDFLAFREQFEFAEGACSVMKAFGELRAKHEEPAKKLAGEARGLFQKGDRAGGRKKYEQLVSECWASTWYPRARGWLAERD